VLLEKRSMEIFNRHPRALATRKTHSRISLESCFFLDRKICLRVSMRPVTGSATLFGRVESVIRILVTRDKFSVRKYERSGFHPNASQ